MCVEIIVPFCSCSTSMGPIYTVGLDWDKVNLKISEKTRMMLILFCINRAGGGDVLLGKDDEQIHSR